MTTAQFITLLFVLGSICARVTPGFKDQPTAVRFGMEVVGFVSGIIVYLIVKLILPFIS